MDEVILTPEQVAQILQVHPFTVLKFIKQGKLKASKLGRVYRIRRTDVDTFLDQQAAKTSSENRANKEDTSDKSKKPVKIIKKASSFKDASGDSSITLESKEAALKEKQPSEKEPNKKEQKTVNVEDVNRKEKEDKATPHRNQEDHYVIELKL